MQAIICRESRKIAGAISALALILIFAHARSAFAQQGHFKAPLQVPPNQSQGGSTLELPTTGGPQGGNTDSIPRFAPQEQKQQLTVPSHELRAQQGYEQVTVTITDQQGRYITDLQKGDFRLYVDGQQRAIEFFRQDLNTPVSLGILVDTSASMEPKIPKAQAAIRELISDLNEQDDVFLFAFSSRPFLLQPFTTNHTQVIERLALLNPFGSTSLFDAIVEGLLLVRHGRWDKKALLVVTDGMDNTSQYTLKEVTHAARRMGVLIYSIGIGETAPSSSPSFMIGPLVISNEGEEVDAQTLRLLSSETGARTFLLREMGDGLAMRNACATISRELREQYTVGFTVPDPSRGGYRDLRVDVPGHSEDTVRVRKGVTVGAGGTEAAAADSPRPYTGP